MPRHPPTISSIPFHFNPICPTLRRDVFHPAYATVRLYPISQLGVVQLLNDSQLLSSLHHSIHLRLCLICRTVIICLTRIQYYDQISSQNALKTLFVITKFLYFPNAVFFSHYCYRHFKQYQLTHSNDQSMEGFQMMSMRSVPGNQPDY